MVVLHPSPPPDTVQQHVVCPLALLRCHSFAHALSSALSTAKEGIEALPWFCWLQVLGLDAPDYIWMPWALADTLHKGTVLLACRTPNNVLCPEGWPVLTLVSSPRCLVAIITIITCSQAHLVFATAEASPFDVAVLELQGSVPSFEPPDLATTFQSGEAVLALGFGVLGRACPPSVTGGVLSAVVGTPPVMLLSTCIMASNMQDTMGTTHPQFNFCVPISLLNIPLVSIKVLTGVLGWVWG
ncbi:UNVERIFIED_CONTAM: hypothetical protein H355_001527 [Colinus virginianus]|nr:hypothetical protein H355_001527 [Colinus virginianus]